jgi:hypothetical protein
MVMSVIYKNNLICVTSTRVTRSTNGQHKHVFIMARASILAPLQELMIF